MSCTLACSEAQPRAQLLLWIDTDAPVVGQLDSDPDLSPAAAIDTLRIDMTDDAGVPFDTRHFVANSPASWPLSFGIAAPDGASSSQVQLRLRALSSPLAVASADGAAAPDTRPGLAIDRLVDIDLPAEGIRSVRVLLSFSCFGVDPDLEARRTCVDSTQAWADATAGIAEADDGAIRVTAAGRSPLARAADCEGEPPKPDAVCIKGGFSLMGDLTVSGFPPSYDLEPAVPLRPVHLSPFWLDRHELTVARMHELLDRPDADFAPPTIRNDSGLELHCTYLGPGDTSTNDWPVNCITWRSAQRACELEGGQLPSEAQWEHAARGRGRQHRYPWGDTLPTCCAASLSRGGIAGIPTICDGVHDEGGEGVEAVGSHLPSEDCDGLGDVTRDGIVDMAGSMSEWMLDAPEPYTAPCWQYAGIAFDPVCRETSSPLRVVRGGNWNSGRAIAHGALRTFVGESSNVVRGLRCAYPAGGSP